MLRENSTLEVEKGNMFQGINSSLGMWKEAMTMFREGRKKKLMR